MLSHAELTELHELLTKTNPDGTLLCTPEERTQLEAVLLEQAKHEAAKPWTKYRHDPIGYAHDVLGIKYLTPDQKKILRAILKPPGMVKVNSGNSLGKGLPVDAVIDTPNGRRRFGDLKVGDEVFGRDGMPTKIIAVHERGVLPVYRVSFSDRSSTVVDGDHLWTVMSHLSRRYEKESGKTPVWQTLSTLELSERGLKRKNHTNRKGQPKISRCWEMPRHKAVSYPPASVPVPPYTMGVWLGDGTCCDGKFTSSDTELIDELEFENGDPINRRLSSDKRSYQFSVPGIYVKLREAGFLGGSSHTKRVPREYMENSISVRLSVLQGLMDTDGTVSKDGSVTFCSTSEGLVDDVIWLARSLGGRASKGPTAKKAFYRDSEGRKIHGKLAYLASIRLSDFPLFRLERKKKRLSFPTSGIHVTRPFRRWIDSIVPEGEAEVRCITVDAEDGLFLANDFIVTHNSHIAAVIVSWFYDSFEECIIVTTAPTKKHIVDILWSEVRLQRSKAIMPIPIDFIGPRAPEMRSSEDHYAYGLVADKAEAIKGRHRARMLFVFDEDEGLPQYYFDAIRTMFKPDEGHIWFSIGNPNTTSSPVYLETRKRNPDGSSTWNTFRMSGLNHPNITEELAGRPPPVPAAVSLAQMDGWVNGLCEVVPEEEKLSTDFLWRGLWRRPSNEAETVILGRRPSGGTSGVWSDALWSACEEIELDFPLDEYPQLGCDVARVLGGDDCDIHTRWGGVSLDHESANGRKIPDTAHRIKEVCEELCEFANRMRREILGAEEAERLVFYPTRVPCKIDDGGVGGAITDLAYGYNFIPVNSGSKANAELKYPRVRSELWFDLADRALLGMVSFKRLTDQWSQTLRIQALSTKWEKDPAGRRCVEEKKTSKKRLGNSPDGMDAVNLAYYDSGLGVASMSGMLPTSPRGETMGSKVGILGRGQDDDRSGARERAQQGSKLWGRRK